jgi:nicotinate-nucleotide adenylyltransferase
LNFSEITALFGGRFDPPHVGHEQAIAGLFLNPGVRDVLVLPTPQPSHKETVARLEQRIEMARLGLIEPFKKTGAHSVKLDLREIERAKHKPGQPTYSFDTLQEIRRDIPKLAFVIGTDQLSQFTSWHRYQETLKLCHWIVLGRKPEGMDLGRKILAEWESSRLVQKSKVSDQWGVNGAETVMILCPTEAPHLSSTEIRMSIARTGEPPQDLLQAEVSAYLKVNKLYGIRGNKL